MGIHWSKHIKISYSLGKCITLNSLWEYIEVNIFRFLLVWKSVLQLHFLTWGLHLQSHLNPRMYNLENHLLSHISQSFKKDPHITILQLMKPWKGPFLCSVAHSCPIPCQSLKSETFIFLFGRCLKQLWALGLRFAYIKLCVIALIRFPSLGSRLGYLAINKGWPWWQQDGGDRDWRQIVPPQLYSGLRKNILWAGLLLMWEPNASTVYCPLADDRGQLYYHLYNTGFGNYP